MADSLFLRLQQNMDRFPDKPAFIIKGRKSAWISVTYRQLSERIDLISRGLAFYRLDPGTRAVMMVPPSIDMFALVFALLKAGIAPVMVDPAIGLKNVTSCLAECRPEVYLGSTVTHGIRRLYGWGRGSLRLNLTLADIRRAGRTVENVQPVQVDPQAEAAIVFTSGSTGLPKGAIYSEANFLAQVDALVNTLQLACDEIDLPAFPLFAMIDCLLGVTAVIPDIRFPSPGRVDPVRMVAAIQSHRVNTLFVSPAALARLSAYCFTNRLQLASLQKVITAGAPAPVDVQRQFVSLLSPTAELLGVYGSTEALPVAVISSAEILQETHALSAQGAGICIGRPASGAQVQIIAIGDEPLSEGEGRRLPTGQIGEITVKGALVTSRYVGREEANRLAKIPTPDGGVIHRMGDLGYYDEKGRLWYCGRKSQRVETSHGTLFTEAVEGVFNVHPLIYRTALVGVEHAGSTEPVLWVELNAAARGADRNTLRAELFELAKAYPPARFIKKILFHPAFPTDVRHNSKIIREKLAELARGRL